jgi:hypothetical protein
MVEGRTRQTIALRDNIYTQAMVAKPGFAVPDANGHPSVLGNGGASQRAHRK